MTSGCVLIKTMNQSIQFNLATIRTLHATSPLHTACRAHFSFLLFIINLLLHFYIHGLLRTFVLFITMTFTLYWTTYLYFCTFYYHDFLHPTFHFDCLIPRVSVLLVSTMYCLILFLNSIRRYLHDHQSDLHKKFNVPERCKIAPTTVHMQCNHN